MLQKLLNIYSEFLVRMATLPYYRLYHFNTIDPLRKIAELASDSPTNCKNLLKAIALWRARKLSELQFITISVSRAGHVLCVR